MALRKEDLRKVRNFLLDICLKWYDLGIELDVEEEVLDEIKSENSNTPKVCLREMLKVRLRAVDDPLTWKILAYALKSKVINEVELARKAEAKGSTFESPASVFSSRVVSLISASEQPTAVDPHIQMNLQHQLRLKHDRIINRYALFVSRLCDSIHDKKVGAKNLRTFLLRLPAFEADVGKDSVKEKLLKTSTINEIIDLIGNECASFLHCDIYKSILEKYCSDIEHEELKYPEHLEAYVNSLKVLEFVELNPELKKLADATNTIAVKVDIMMASKFSKILNLQLALASTLGVWPSKLKLVSIEEGCVIVTFKVPGHKIPEVERLKRNSEELQSQSVHWLKCGNYKLDFKDRSLLRHKTHKASIDKAASIGPQPSHYDYLPPKLIHSEQPPRMSTATAIGRNKFLDTKYPRNTTSLKQSTARVSLASHSWFSSSEHWRVPPQRHDSTDSASVRKKHYPLQRHSSCKPEQSLSKEATKSYIQHNPRTPSNPQGVQRVPSLRMSRDPAPVPDKYATIPRRTKAATRTSSVVGKVSRGGSTASEYNHRHMMYRFRTRHQKHKDRLETSSLRPPSLSLEPAQQSSHRPSFYRSDKKHPPKFLQRTRLEDANSDSPAGQTVSRISPPLDSSPEDVKYPNLQNLTHLIWTDSDKMKHKLEVVRRVCAKFTTIGILLGLDLTKIDGCVQESVRDSYQCCIRVFSKWIENNGHPPKYPRTWTGLCQLLYSINETVVEEELAEALSRIGITVNASSW